MTESVAYIQIASYRKRKNNWSKITSRSSKDILEITSGNNGRVRLCMAVMAAYSPKSLSLFRGSSPASSPSASFSSPPLPFPPASSEAFLTEEVELPPFFFATQGLSPPFALYEFLLSFDILPLFEASVTFLGLSLSLRQNALSSPLLLFLAMCFRIECSTSWWRRNSVRWCELVLQKIILLLRLVRVYLLIRR